MKYILGALCVVMVGCQKKGCEDKYLNFVKVNTDYKMTKGLYEGCTFTPYVRVAGPYFSGMMRCIKDNTTLTLNPVSVDFREVFEECAE